MRRHIEHWIDLDIHEHFGTEWLTGGPVGQWYSVNDFAMTRLVRDYVRFTGDSGFLDASVGPKPVAEHLHDWATAWRGLRGEHALADYGGIDNLLECVSSYVHEVASFNAANVWCLRVAAEVAERSGDADRAELLRKEADEQAGHVNELYIEGAGFWHARQPDGSLIPVRHCYDFNIIGTTIAADLSESQRAEMVSFFQRELQTPEWMRALSPYDADAAFSVRPDHQWNGAYPAWPHRQPGSLRPSPLRRRGRAVDVRRCSQVPAAVPVSDRLGLLLLRILGQPGPGGHLRRRGRPRRDGHRRPPGSSPGPRRPPDRPPRRP
jgi:hypothetical protein